MFSTYPVTIQELKDSYDEVQFQFRIYALPDSRGFVLCAFAQDVTGLMPDHEIVLHTARGQVRVFQTLDAAFATARKIASFTLWSNCATYEIDDLTPSRLASLPASSAKKIGLIFSGEEKRYFCS